MPRDDRRGGTDRPAPTGPGQDIDASEPTDAPDRDDEDVQDPTGPGQDID